MISTYLISDEMCRFSEHALRQMEARGVSIEDVREVLRSGELFSKEADERFGTKYQSRLRRGRVYLVVVWHYAGDEKEAITAFWRRLR